MFTKEYVREILEQMCAPYMKGPLSDEYVQKIYDDFVEIRNSGAVEHSVQSDGLWDCANCENRKIGGGFAECPNCGTARR